MKMTFHDIKRETIKIFGNYLGICAEPASDIKRLPGQKIESPDFFNNRVNRRDRVAQHANRLPS